MCIDTAKKGIYTAVHGFINNKTGEFKIARQSAELTEEFEIFSRDPTLKYKNSESLGEKAKLYLNKVKKWIS